MNFLASLWNSLAFEVPRKTLRHTGIAQEYRVDYLPGESDSGMFGGDSTGEAPSGSVNAMIIRALRNSTCITVRAFRWMPYRFRKDDEAYSESLQGDRVDRLRRMFLRDETGSRPISGGSRKVKIRSPIGRTTFCFRVFHGDMGTGLGASHQTGWTGLVAKLIEFSAPLTHLNTLAHGKRREFEKEEREVARGR